MSADRDAVAATAAVVDRGAPGARAAACSGRISIESVSGALASRLQPHLPSLK